jgi:hypothetical protein
MHINSKTSNIAKHVSRAIACPRIFHPGTKLYQTSAHYQSLTHIQYNKHPLLIANTKLHPALQNSRTTAPGHRIFHGIAPNMDHIAELRKRKGTPIPSHRPSKRRPDIPTLPINGHETPNSEPVYAVESDEEVEGATLPLVTVADSVEWQATIERVVRNVVSIHFCQTCSFDTDPACSSEATGFVVDAEKGYIMTNRHVVGYDEVYKYLDGWTLATDTWVGADRFGVIAYLTITKSVMSIPSTVIPFMTLASFASTLQR